MSQIRCELPKYPVDEDVWDALAAETRPIVVYGMGNGADKLFSRFEQYSIKVCDVFASDGFVRGHSFRGYRVLSFSEIKEKYRDFVIVLSFASNRKEVVEMLEEIDASFEMYIPDMPVAGGEYFDREFYNKHYQEMLSVYGMLADDESKHIYASVINFRLTGKMKYLTDSVSNKDEMYSLISERGIKKMIDAGAYNGDTAKEALKYFNELESIYALEPDRRNFKKLLKFAEENSGLVTPINAAVWNECKEGIFLGSGNRNSSVASTASYEHKSAETALITLDSLLLSDVDYIKYDVEGAELEALLGSLETIERSAPALLVSLYHKSEDVFTLPRYIYEKYKKYKLYIRRLYSVPAWELNLIAIPRDLQTIH